MDDREDDVDQRRAADAEGALDEQIGGQPGADADDRGQAGARAQDEPAEQRDQHGAMQAEREPRLGAVEETGEGEGEAGDDQRDPPAGNGQFLGQGAAGVRTAMPAAAHVPSIPFSSSSGAKSRSEGHKSELQSLMRISY